MAALTRQSGATAADPKGSKAVRPLLHLSGPKLRVALERLVAASERVGGIERFAAAVRLKSSVLQERLADGKAADLSRAAFEEIVPLMATVRRRVGPLIEARSWETTQRAIATLLDGAQDTTVADQRIAAFEFALRPVLASHASSPGAGASTSTAAPEGKASSHRFLRDLASELLHNALPEHYPLMHRWVWDTRANSGVVREIWHDPERGDDTDSMVIDVPDGYETHLVLREELSQFLADNGVFRDMLWHVDLVCAQIYADYINAQGGAWLKTDFGSESDPIEHTRRILGLDRVARSRARVSGEWSVVSGAIGKDG